MTAGQPILFGDPASRYTFLQLGDAHDMALMARETAALTELAGRDFCIAAVPVDDWFGDLTPWRADPVFGKQAFGDGAERTLRRLIDGTIPVLEAAHPAAERAYIPCGYSLAGLFALWAAYRTDRFAGVVAASPSVWYPGWIAYAQEHSVLAPRVYLSLGDREEKARNPVLAAVGSCIREQHGLLEAAGVTCRLDWNPGNHFVDSDRRMARGMAWMLETLRGAREERETQPAL